MELTDNIVNKIITYNGFIENYIAELKKLKLNVNKLSVREMQALRNTFALLTSAKRRKIIEKAFADVYDTYTDELAEYVEILKQNENNR